MLPLRVENRIPCITAAAVLQSGNRAHCRGRFERTIKMKIRSTVLLGCITVLVSPTFARATGDPALAHTAEYVVRHWKNEFAELERQIKETGELCKRGQNPYKDISRWDYIDRENGLGSKFWTCYPDGRDPRAPHGNYPHPYSVQREYTGPKEGTRNRGACSEMHFRAIPNSHRYIFTGVPHQGAAFGPLALLDTRIRDKGTMNQITVITADPRFPESQTREGIETDDRILKYGTA